MLITEATGLALDDDRLTPNLLAEKASATLVELLPLRDAAKSKREHKELSARIKSLRVLIHWAKTRAGYVPKPKGGALPAGGFVRP